MGVRWSPDPRHKSDEEPSDNFRKTLTFVAGLRTRGMTAPFVLDGAINRSMFLAYWKRCLVPTLKRGDIVHNALRLFRRLRLGSLTLVPRREPRILSGSAAGREGLLIGSL